MKSINWVVNGVLAIAVIVLYVLHFNSANIPIKSAALNGAGTKVAYFEIDTIQKMKFGGYQNWQKSRLPKHPPPRFVDFKMPSSLFLLLFYSDCCTDTYYPDNFGSLVPLINHITLRVM